MVVDSRVRINTRRGSFLVGVAGGHGGADGTAPQQHEAEGDFRSAL